MKNRSDKDLHERFFIHSPDLLCVIDKKGHFITLNPAWSDILGYEPEELAGQACTSIVHPDDADKLRSFLAPSGNQQAIAEPTMRFRHSNGQYLCLSWRFTLEEEVIFATARDISETVEKTKRLNKFRYSVEKALDGILWLNEDGGIDYANEQACIMLGYTGEEIRKIGLSDYDPLYPIEKHKEDWATCQRTRLEGEVHIETINRRKDGSEFPVEVRAKHLWLDEDQIHVVHFRDLSESKEQQSTLRKFRASIDIATDAVYWINEEGSFDYVNEEACSMLGYTFEELTRLTLDDIVADYSVREHKQRFRQLMQTGMTSRVHFASTHIRKDGTSLPVEISTIFTLHENKGMVINFARDVSERLKFEKELMLSSQMLRKVLDNIPVRVFWKDRSSVYLGCNQAFASDTMLRNIDDIIGKTDFEIFPNHMDAEAYVADDEGIMSSGKAKLDYVETQTRGKDDFWLRTSKVPLLDDEGEVFGILGTYEDFTARKQAEIDLVKAKERAEESEFFLEQSQRTGRIGSYDLSFAKGFWRTTDALNDIFGIDDSYEKDTAGWLNLVHPEDHEMMSRYFSEEVTGKQKPFNKEYRIVRQSDGLCRWVHGVGKLFLDEDGQLSHMLGTIQDITTKKEAEIALRQEKERTQKYLDIAAVMLISIDARQQVTLINPKGCEILGRPEDEILGANWFERFVPAENRKEVMEVFDRILAGKIEEVKYFESPIVRKDGTERLIAWNNTILRDQDGNITGLFSSGEDITERKFIEEERKRMNVVLEQQVEKRTRQLQQANSELEGFAYSISHDLRAPLRHINGYMHIIRNAVDELDVSDPKLKDYFEKVNGASLRMSVMIDELLNFSRLGRTELRLNKVDLNSTIAEVIEQFKPDYINRTIHWEIQTISPVKGDSVLLRIVIENLVSNAIKYSATTDPARIEIGELQADNNNVCFFIRDNGVGFNTEYKSKLFGVFKRLHKNEEFEGIGIGLANVKQILTRHNGHIDAESEIGKGSTFTITLPAAID